MKLDELGLSLEDLSDEDNLASLATAMNEGAANMGLPTIEDLDSAVSTLYEKLSANWSSYFKVEKSSMDEVFAKLSGKANDEGKR